MEYTNLDKNMIEKIKTDCFTDSNLPFKKQPNKVGTVYIFLDRKVIINFFQVIKYFQKVFNLHGYMEKFFCCKLKNSITVGLILSKVSQVPIYLYMLRSVSTHHNFIFKDTRVFSFNRNKNSL